MTLEKECHGLDRNSPADEQMDKLIAIAQAADESLEDVAIVTRAQARLALALHELDPTAIHAKDNCTCGESYECDECQPLADSLAYLRNLAAPPSAN